jgi:pimeloyl-ACP methyl ester carboxylesterase
MLKSRQFVATFFLIALLVFPATSEGPASGYQPPVDVAFTATLDQSEQRYVLLLPVGHQTGQTRDLVIALHGHGADRWQFATNERGECKAARDAAAARGMIFVSPDYRAKTSWMGPAAEADLLQIIQELKAQYAIGRVVLCGGSMGGTSALTFTALHPEWVDGVVALNGTANHLEYEKFQEAIRESFGGSKQEVPEEYYKRSAEYWPLKFTMPVALTTSGLDTDVPPDSVMRLADILKKLNPAVLHIHRPDAGHATSYEDTVAAMKFVLERLTKP